MALVISLALAGGTLVATAMARRKPGPPHIVDALINGKPKQATLLPPATQQALTRVQELAQDLFGDTRQQYQQTLSTTAAVDSEQRAETVSRILCCNGVSETELLRYAAAAEAKQSHPVARAIIQTAADQGLALPLLKDAEYKVGYGLKAETAGRTTVVGSLRLMTLEGFAVPPELIEQQAESHAQGHSLVLVALDGEVVGAIELQPTIWLRSSLWREHWVNYPRSLH